MALLTPRGRSRPFQYLYADGPKCSKLKKVIGIAVDAPKYSESLSRDFLLMKCEEWPDSKKQFFKEQNKEFGFFTQKSARPKVRTIEEFPSSSSSQKNKIGRNETCPCGSGKKFKKCCGAS